MAINFEVRMHKGTIKFPPNNEIIYSQDFSQWKGMPSDVVFEVEANESRAKLIAPGYGGKPYGNGAIYLYRVQNEKRMQ